jgi:hypothetical protein
LRAAQADPGSTAAANLLERFVLIGAPPGYVDGTLND